MSNVLIATATYGDAMRPETVRSVRETVFGGSWQWYQSRHNPHPAPSRANWLAQYRHISEYVLVGEWDAVLLVEHDMEVPPHALQALWDTGSPVAYGVYLLRHGAYVLSAYEYIGTGAIGESLTHHREALAAAWDQQIVRVSGIGFGCTLIRREILQRIPFRSVDGGAPDMPFAQDCEAAGIMQVAHFGAACGHWDDRTQTMMVPSRDGVGAMMDVRALQTMYVNIEGASLRIVAGQTYPLPIGDALELIRVGYVEAHATGDSDAHIRAAAEGNAAQPAKPARAKRRKMAANSGH